MYAFQSGMSKGDDERMLQGWEMLEENINRITTFVKEFLEFARGRTPTVHLIDPNEVAAKVVDLFKDKAEMAGIRLGFEPQAGVPPAFMDEEGIHDNHVFGLDQFAEARALYHELAAASEPVHGEP